MTDQPGRTPKAERYSLVAQTYVGSTPTSWALEKRLNGSFVKFSDYERELAVAQEALRQERAIGFKMSADMTVLEQQLEQERAARERAENAVRKQTFDLAMQISDRKKAEERAAQAEAECDALRTQVATEYVRGREHQMNAVKDADYSWKERAEQAEARIAGHNAECQRLCELRRDCEPYRSRQRECPDCPLHWIIDENRAALAPAGGKTE